MLHSVERLLNYVNLCLDIENHCKVNISKKSVTQERGSVNIGQRCFHFCCYSVLARFKCYEQQIKLLSMRQKWPHKRLLKQCMKCKQRLHASFPLERFTQCTSIFEIQNTGVKKQNKF